MYKIKYNYDTGNSFTNEYGLEDELELTWNNLDAAKENLKRIGEHYVQYNFINDDYRNNLKQCDKLLESNKNKDWFVNKIQYFLEKENDNKYSQVIDKEYIEKYKNNKEFKVVKKIDKFQAQCNIILYTDDNKPWQIFAPWCGYFENLNYVEIINEQSDLKIYM